MEEQNNIHRETHLSGNISTDNNHPSENTSILFHLFKDNKC